jgi:hypothetical protein
MSEIINRKVTVEVTVPKSIFISWDEFCEEDTGNFGSIVGRYLSALHDGMSTWFHDRELEGIIEPPFVHGDYSEIEDAYQTIIAKSGTEKLKDRNFVFDVLDTRARHDEDAAEQSDTNMRMLEAFGYPETLEELTEQIRLHFYADEDYSYLGAKNWFYEPYLEILVELLNTEWFDDSFYEAVSDIVQKKLREATPAIGHTALAYIENMFGEVTDIRITSRGIDVEFTFNCD